MATEVRKLKDGKGNIIAPVTSTKAVINETGQNVETLLDEKVETLRNETIQKVETLRNETIQKVETLRNEKVGFRDATGNPGIPKLPDIDLSLIDIYGKYIGTRETANCYVINAPGYYKFPLIYGNAIKDGANNTQAYISAGGQYQSEFVNMFNNPISSPYIEEDIDDVISSAEVLISDEPDIISDLEIIDDFPCKLVRFHVSSIPKAGANAVIGVKNNKSNIAWSWHIWLWDQISHPLEEVEIKNHEGNNYNILNYNLGSKFDNDNSHLKNWYYQWGKKDPMLLPESYNSNNNNHTSYGTTSFSIEPCAASVSESIKNPCTFYKSDKNYNYNWVQLNYYYNFWDATCKSAGATEKVIVKTIYDPCPRGFTVPNARVFTGFTSTGDWTNTAEQFNVIGSFANGWYFKKNESDSTGAFFPASGHRFQSSGDLRYVGVYGDYWSAGVYDATSAYHLRFGSGSVDPLYCYSRANAFSVRPVKGGGA